MAGRENSAKEGAKTPGRKRLDPAKASGGNRRNLSLTDADMEIAERIGGGKGKASKGIRIALAAYESTQKEDA